MYRRGKEILRIVVTFADPDQSNGRPLTLAPPSPTDHPRRTNSLTRSPTSLCAASQSRTASNTA
jgi:hypothetical protein